MRSYLTFIFFLLFLSACQNDVNNVPEPTIDWETWGTVMVWTEIESKSGDSDWVTIPNGNELTFFYNPSAVDSIIPEKGAYIYEPSININIKPQAYFERTDSKLVLLSYSKAKVDTTILAYRYSDNATFVLSDTTVTPTVQIKYRRKD